MTEREAGDSKYLWLPSTDGGEDDTGLTVESARDIYLTDTSGRVFLDANSGLWNVPFGYNSPFLEAAVRENLISSASLFCHPHKPAVDISRELSRRLPPYSKFFLVCSGSAAADTAVRMVLAACEARGCRRRLVFGHLPGSYHGVTLAALSLMGLESYRGNAAGLLESRTLPDPWKEDAAGQLPEFFDRHGDRIAAVFIEYVQGSGGVRRVPADYVGELQRLANAHGVYVIGDEVATGIYRSGPFVLAEENGCWPDLLLLGKAITGGYASLSVVCASKELFECVTAHPATRRLLGFTTGGHPLGCSLGLAVLRHTEGEEFRVTRELGASFLARNRSTLGDCPQVKEVRGWGHMYGVELEAKVLQRLAGRQGFVRRVTSEAVNQRLFIHPLSVGVIPLFPAFSATEGQLTEMIERLSRVLRAL